MSVRSVLIVDDELCKPAEANVFREEFRFEGIEYLFAGNGPEMMEILGEIDSICAVFLDIRFESLGSEYGLELLKMLKQGGVPIPAVMMSSLSEAETIIKAWSLGAQGYVLKSWSEDRFRRELREKVLEYAREVKPSTAVLIERKRNRIRTRYQTALKAHSQISDEDLIVQAIRFKENIGGEWINSIPFQPSFQNYLRGWNETDEVLNDAVKNHRLLYLNLDFGTGCTLRCPHCFTQQGAIDARGRQPLDFDRLKESILDAKTLGLRCVRILGRGEPTQWVCRPTRSSSGNTPHEGQDIVDFIKFLYDNDIIPLVFTRGQIIGNDEKIAAAYQGVHGVNSGEDLIRLLNSYKVSLFLGVSSIFPGINNEMVGLPDTSRFDYDGACRRSLKLAIAAGFNTGSPTRLAVEMPITNLNVKEMGVRYVLFQLLNISPCTNVYMVTGRAMTFGLGEITDPPQEEFVDNYAMVTRFARNMGIDVKIGAYAGTKECYDISCGMYLTLNGDIYPCPGYEGISSFVGSLRSHTIRQIWDNNSSGGHWQSICPPKIGTHFPPDFKARVEKQILKNSHRYDQLYSRIRSALRV